MIKKIINFFKTKTVSKRIISDDDFNLIKKQKEDKLNLILDKISKKGIDSLSKKELEFLKNK